MSWEDFTSSSGDVAQSSSDISQNSVQAAKTPQYTITNPDLFQSSLDNTDIHGTDTAPCIWVDSGHTRLMTYDASGKIRGDGRITAKQTLVCMKAGQWIPGIQQYLSEGHPLETVIIKRIIILMGLAVPVQTTTYFDVVITFFKQKGDIILFAFSYSKLTDVYTLYDADGNSTGNKAVTIDYETLKITGGE